MLTSIIRALHFGQEGRSIAANGMTDVNLRPHQGWQTAKVNVGARALSASITRAGIWREVLEFVRLPLPLLRVGRGRFFDRNLWPDFRVFRIQRQPFLEPRVGVGFYGVHRAFRHANTAVNAFVRMDHKHVLALVETIHGAHLDAVHDFAANAAVIDDVGQSRVLSTNRSVARARAPDRGARLRKGAGGGQEPSRRNRHAGAEADALERIPNGRIYAFLKWRLGGQQ